jgi:hypothetical protein
MIYIIIIKSINISYINIRNIHLYIRKLATMSNLLLFLIKLNYDFYYFIV